ncbi:hypothetical protein [Paraburkholderia ferrariae]|uniref:hypothetical protein n=1 Tax=Paraburkholderia ferrariae TaxID=386056 RepID=UPI000488AE1B|nr:hypothetical protein [Paraburkholderia ferrariae]
MKPLREIICNEVAAQDDTKTMSALPKMLRRTLQPDDLSRVFDECRVVLDLQERMATVCLDFDVRRITSRALVVQIFKTCGCVEIDLTDGATSSTSNALASLRLSN